jgi:hypothetical protein
MDFSIFDNAERFGMLRIKPGVSEIEDAFAFCRPAPRMRLSVLHIYLSPVFLRSGNR